MKKLLYILLALCAISCTQSNEDKITSAFKEYVKTNFDDPSQFEEIVSIDSPDTVSTQNFKLLAQFKYDLLLQAQIICDSLDSILTNKYYTDEINKQRLRKMPRLDKYLIQANFLAEEKIEFLSKNVHIKSAEQDLNKIMALKDTLLYQYKLSYRIKTSDGLKLKTKIVYTDSLYNNIQFKEDILKIDEEPIKEVTGRIDDFDNKYDPLLQLYLKEIENSSEELRLIEAYIEENY